MVEVDGRPLSRYGCDGVVCATPTGSTAYAFSAGGPVVWPEVEALLLVPISAHALFSRPLVAAPTSTIVVTVDPHAPLAVLCCDGRRTVDLPPGARVTVRRGARPVRVVRLRPRPFTDRLVAKFELPVGGVAPQRALSAGRRPAGHRLARLARGSHGAANVGLCWRSCASPGSGVIEDATLPLAPGLTVITGETGAGKTMVVTGLGLLFGGRADAGRVRAEPRPRGGGGAAAVSGATAAAVHGRVAEAGAEPDDDGSLLLSRTVTAEGRSRAHVGGRSVPVAVLAEVGEQVVAVHGQSDQLRLLRPAEQRAALDRFAGADHEKCSPPTGRLTPPGGGSGTSWPSAGATRGSGTRRPTCCGWGWMRSSRVDPQPGEDEALRAEAQRLEHAEGLRSAAATRYQALAGGGRPATTRPTPRRCWASRGGRWRRRGRRPPRWGNSPRGWRRPRPWSADVAAELAATSTRWTPTRTGSPRSTSGGPRCVRSPASTPRTSTG